MALMDPVGGSGSSHHRNPDLETTKDGDEEHVLLDLGKNSELEREACHSASSSSDSSSEEDFFQLDATDLSKAIPATSDVASGSLRFPNPVADGSSLTPEIEMQGAATVPQNSPTGQGAETPGKLDLLGATQSPPAQVMARSDAPDPYRIPSSVFERTKSTAPMEWSVASNESLFSIHMGGNNSFSRDHAILLEMEKSGELGNFYCSTPDNRKGLEPPLTAEELNAEAMKDVLREKDVLRAAADCQADKDRTPTESAPLCSSVSRRSNGSATSINSFAFPILTGEVRTGSVKVEPEKEPHGQKQAPNENQNVEASNAAQGSWWPCLTCGFCRS